MKEFFKTLIDLRKRRTRFLWLFAGAALTGFTLVYPQIGFVAWVGLVPSLLAVTNICTDERMRKRGLYGYGFFFFFSFFFVNFHWFVNLYPLDFIAEMTKPAALCVVIVAWFGLSALQALSAGLVFPIFALIYKSSLAKKIRILPAVSFSALWAILEWTQTLGWVGVPWARLSISQTYWLWEAQTASLFGCCFVSFLIVLVNLLLAEALRKADKRKCFAVTAAAVFLINTVAGCLLYYGYSDKGDPVKIGAVQGNISSQEKWDKSLTQKTLDAYEYGTEEAAEQGAKIVVWPESALPYNLDTSFSMNNFASRVARQSGVTILVGAFSLDDEGNEYNSVIVFTPDGERFDTVYSKRHLVPFGEFVPLRGLISVLIPPLTELSMLSEDLIPGDNAEIFFFDEGAVGSLICFDSIYDELARDSVREGAEVLAISTNDSWFLDSAALDMHFAQAKLRAIENRRYVVRAANTGVSGVISPTGRVVADVEPLTEDNLTCNVYLNQSRTLYTYIGNLFVYICIAAVIGLLLNELLYKYRSKK